MYTKADVEYFGQDENLGPLFLIGHHIWPHITKSQSNELNLLHHLSSAYSLPLLPSSSRVSCTVYFCQECITNRWGLFDVIAVVTSRIEGTISRFRYAFFYVVIMCNHIFLVHQCIRSTPIATHCLRARSLSSSSVGTSTIVSAIAVTEYERMVKKKNYWIVVFLRCWHWYHSKKIKDTQSLTSCRIYLLRNVSWIPRQTWRCDSLISLSIRSAFILR